MGEQVVSVAAVARQIGVSPRVLTDLFYKRILDADRCPVVDGRRAIPIAYVPGIKSVLIDRGVIADQRAVACKA